MHITTSSTLHLHDPQLHHLHLHIHLHDDDDDEARRQDVVEITEGSKAHVMDIRDPGGVLGPYLVHAQPDLRNKVPTPTCFFFFFFIFLQF